MSSVILAGDTSGTITLQAPAVAGTSVLTLPIATDTLVGLTTTDTLTNKTLTAPILTTPALGTPASGIMTNVTGTASGLTAGNVTTNANLTGALTSVGNATSLGSFTSAQLSGALTDETGTGVAVFATSPTLVTPALGTPASGVVTNLTGTASININGTVGANTPSTGAFTTGTFSGTLGVTGVATLGNGAILGTPASGVLTNATGLPISSGVSGLGTSVATALGVNTGSAGAFVVNGGALGSPSSAGTIPAFTLGGTVAGGGNQLNNVIIGTSNPLAGAFTTLSATGTSTLAGVTATKSSGTVAAFTQTGATGYGLVIVPGADTVYDALGINNAANTLNMIRMFGNGTATFAGGVGIGGAASPGSTGLAITGTLSASGAITSTLATGQWLGNNSGNTTTLYSIVNNSGGYLYQGVSSSTGGGWSAGLNSNYASVLGTLGNTDLIFGTQNNGRMKIAGSDGAVTISGTLAAGATTVTGTLSATGEFTGTSQLLSAGSSSTTLLTNYTLRFTASGTAANYSGIFFDGSTVYDSFFGRVPSALSGINDGVGYVTYAGGAPTLRTLFSSTGLAVTGTGSFTGNIVITKATGVPSLSLAATTGTNEGFFNISNTGGNYYYGVENSVGSWFGATAYAMAMLAPSGKVIQHLIAGSVITTTSSTGLAVTGDISLPTTKQLGWGASPFTCAIEGASGAAGYIRLFTNNAERVRLDASGNLGIGTNSPVANNKLTIDNGASSYGLRINSSATPGMQLSVSGTSNTFITGDAAAYTIEHLSSIVLRTNNATRATLDSSGNVGLGASSPSSPLEIYRNTASGGGSLYPNIKLNNAHASGYTGFYFYNDATQKAFLELKNDVGALLIGTGSTERMRIDSSGNLLVGTTTNSNFAAKLTVVPAYAQTAASFESSNANYASISTWNNQGNYPANQITFHIGTGSPTEVGKITSTATATAYNTSSDYRLKENVQPLTGALATVTALKPVTFNWKSDGSDGQGFIAHELQAVVPDCVTGEKDATAMQTYEISPAIPATQDEEGNELTAAVEAIMGEREVPKYQGVDTSFLVATLTAAIQELNAKFEEYKSTHP